VSLLALSCIVTADASASLYVRADVGYSWSTKITGDDEDFFKRLSSATPVLGVGIGYTVNKNIRSDFTISYRRYKYRYIGNRQDFSSVALWVMDIMISLSIQDFHRI
jgi:opacity protein-like surface antigen